MSLLDLVPVSWAFTYSTILVRSSFFSVAASARTLSCMETSSSPPASWWLTILSAYLNLVLQPSVGHSIEKSQTLDWPFSQETNLAAGSSETVLRHWEELDHTDEIVLGLNGKFLHYLQQLLLCGGGHSSGLVTAPGQTVTGTGPELVNDALSLQPSWPLVAAPAVLGKVPFSLRNVLSYCGPWEFLCSFYV